MFGRKHGSEGMQRERWFSLVLCFRGPEWENGPYANTTIVSDIALLPISVWRRSPQITRPSVSICVCRGEAARRHPANTQRHGWRCILLTRSCSYQKATLSSWYTYSTPRFPYPLAGSRDYNDALKSSLECKKGFTITFLENLISFNCYVFKMSLIKIWFIMNFETLNI